MLLNNYLMEKRQGCLVLKGAGKPYKILKVLDPLGFVGWIKHLSVAIDTGATQNCEYGLCAADRLSRLLKCRFSAEIVSLELWVLKKLKFNWQGTAREFRDAVDRMISRLPNFF